MDDTISIQTMFSQFANEDFWDSGLEERESISKSPKKYKNLNLISIDCKV